MCIHCKELLESGVNDNNRLCSTHVVNQLMSTQHSEVTLFQNGRIEEMSIECRSCSMKNVLVLGLVPTQSDSVVILLIHQPQPISISVKDETRNAESVDQSLPSLSVDCFFLSWLVNTQRKCERQEVVPHLSLVTSATNSDQSSKVSDLKDFSPIKSIRKKVRKNKKLQVKSNVSTQNTIVRENNNASKENKFDSFHKNWRLKRPYVVDFNIEPQKGLLRYCNGSQYESIFSPLVKLEADYDKYLKELQTQDQVSLRWKILLNKKILAYFILSKTDGAFKLTLGDKLKLRYTGEASKSWTGIGSVIKIPDNWSDETGIELLKKSTYIPLECTSDYSVDFVWRSTGFDRMQLALKKFAANDTSVSAPIHNRILGHMRNTDEALFSWYDLELYPIPNLPELNQTQAAAVQHAIRRPLSLIQGPPGTGKTLTSLSIVYQIVKNNNGKVLVCASSNIAVDQLTENLHKTKLKVVRLCAELRDSVDSPVAFLTLSNQIRNSESNAELEKLHHRFDRGELSTDDEVRFWSLKKAAERELLDEADVICCTCIGAGDSRLAGIKFQAILIDEAMQATEPECMIPAVLGCDQLILVGDQCQLGPIVKCTMASRAGLSMSLFERLVKIGSGTFLLDIQYRMHPELCQFPSKFFYDAFLRNGVTADERRLPEEIFPWPVPDKPTLFYVVEGTEEIAGSSFLNSAEAFIVEKMTTQFLRNGIKPERIGIITPYEGQRAYLAQCMQYRGALQARVYQQIEVAKVDAFQGREKDIIIMSCVRSNDNREIGFLKDPRRLNVALTRAKFGLIIIGNPKVLSKQTVWYDLLNFYREKKLLVEGPLSNLVESHIEFCRPRKLFQKT